LFEREAPRLALLAQEMAERFLRGGRLLAFGKGSAMTDAQHVAVEFVHPVIVGKRALPALDISPAFQAWLKTTLQPDDIVMGFAPPRGDEEVAAALALASRRGALTIALTGEADYALALPEHHPFIQQELIEILYHSLWETVHVFFEHHGLGHDVGASSFLYPFLSEKKQAAEGILEDVAGSIQAKAQDLERLREMLAETATAALADVIRELGQRLERGGKFITFGNGGSATDANDFVLDCLMPPADLKAIPALSLALESANVSAIANDVGVDVIFSRQLIAQAQPQDIAIAFSTSGSSKNIVATLKEAGKRGLFTLALLGYDGGEIARYKLADSCVVVPSDYIPRIQEVHASLYHVLLQGLALPPGR
jgi:D-sedoheptulose 7-phosphate isomerase